MTVEISYICTLYKQKSICLHKIVFVYLETFMNFCMKQTTIKSTNKYYQLDRLNRRKCAEQPSFLKKEEKKNGINVMCRHWPKYNYSLFRIMCPSESNSDQTFGPLQAYSARARAPVYIATKNRLYLINSNISLFNVYENDHLNF